MSFSPEWKDAGDLAQDGKNIAVPEITPEMIEAGRQAISRKWLDFTGPHGSQLWDEVLSETFRAMWAMRPQSLC